MGITQSATCNREGHTPEPQSSRLSSHTMLSPDVWCSPYWQALEVQTGKSCRSPNPKLKENKKKNRFIPTRVVDPDVTHLNLTKENSTPDSTDQRERKEYENLLSHSLFDGQPQRRVLSFVPRPKPSIAGFENGLREVFDWNRTATAPPQR